MNSQASRTQTESATLPPDLAGIASQLDALARADRAGAPRGLQDRLVAAFADAAAPAPMAPEPASLPFPVARSGSLSMWRMAAAIALSVAVLGGLTWVASLSPLNVEGTVSIASAGEAQNLAQDLEQFIASAESWDLGVSDSIASAREAIESASSDNDFWSDQSSDALLLEDTL